MKTHVWWKDWQTYQIICEDCYENSGAQWQSDAGWLIPRQRKLEIHKHAYEQAEHTHCCERCDALLSGDVVEQKFEQNPYPLDQWGHPIDESEMRKESMFDFMTDEAIADWIEGRANATLEIDPKAHFFLLEALTHLVDLGATTPFDKETKNRFSFLEGMLESAMSRLQAKRDPLLKLLTQHLDRHEDIIEILEERVDAEFSKAEQTHGRSTTGAGDRNGTASGEDYDLL